MTSQRLPKLTTTSFALLGLLQRRPWSAYELTRYMRGSILRAIWPRAESHLYSEPKSLEKRGFVVSHQEHNGARKRTVYSITDAGRSALSLWLQEERESEFRFEYELLVRFAFAENTDVSQVQQYLHQVQAEALRDASFALSGVDAMLQEQELKRSGYVAYNGAMIHLLVDQVETRLNWAAGMLERFSAASGGAVQPALAEDLLQSAAERLRALLAANGS
jgi:PadR family transcriptional regulator AphA